jgi:hypothetical protein
MDDLEIGIVGVKTLSDEASSIRRVVIDDQDPKFRDRQGLQSVHKTGKVLGFVVGRQHHS